MWVWTRLNRGGHMVPELYDWRWKGEGKPTEPKPSGGPSTNASPPTP